MKNLFKEFKEFISKGNVLDLAIAVVMGAAFSAIVNSLVNDIIMPLFGIIFGKSFSSLYWDLNGSLIMYGAFIQAIVDFLVISLCIFLFMKAINKFKRKEEKKEEAKKSDEVVLLEEIRDLLKKKEK